MVSTKNYNKPDCEQQLLLVQNESGEYGGYKRDLLANYLNELEYEMYVCTLCNGIMQNACQIGDEQNLVCENCVPKGEKAVPMSKSRKKIPNLRVKCPLEERRCEWEGHLGEIDIHLNECTEFIVNCSNLCGVILKRSELKNHCENECINRNVSCMHCKAVMLYKEVEIHFTTCPDLPLLCINECMQTFIRKEMNSHIENECPNTLVDCANECGLKLKRSNLAVHCKEECQHRIVYCGYCSDPMRHKVLENHYKSCLEFPVVCPNECMRSMTRKELETHIEKECPNTLVDCANECGLKLKRSNLSVHCKEECHHRIVYCSYCSDPMQYKVLENHYKSCLEFPVVCPNECMRSLTRKELEPHIEEECPNTVVACRYEEIGCHLKLRRSNLAVHCEEECQHRIVNCGYCSDPMQHQVLENHYKSCLEFPVVCPNECMRSLTRKELEPHIEKKCPNTQVHCINECGLKMKRSKISIHCEKKCQLRIVRCKYCQATMQYKELDIHFSICLEYPLLCPNECMESVIRKEMNTHIEQICPNMIVDCMNKCGLRMKRSKLSIHLGKKCLYRIVNCRYCEDPMKFKVLANHYKLCPEFPLVCPNQCFRSMVRKEIASHVDNDCPNTLVACPFKEMGCEIISKRCEVQEHENKFESKHLKITLEYYPTRVKKLEIELQKKDQEIEKLSEKVRTYEGGNPEPELEKRPPTPESLTEQRPPTPEPEQKPDPKLSFSSPEPESVTEQRPPTPVPRQKPKHKLSSPFPKRNSEPESEPNLSSSFPVPEPELNFSYSFPKQKPEPKLSYQFSYPEPELNFSYLFPKQKPESKLSYQFSYPEPEPNFSYSFPKQKPEPKLSYQFSYPEPEQNVSYSFPEPELEQRLMVETEIVPITKSCPMECNQELVGTGDITELGLVETFLPTPEICKTTSTLQIAGRKKFGVIKCENASRKELKDPEVPPALKLNYLKVGFLFVYSLTDSLKCELKRNLITLSHQHLRIYSSEKVNGQKPICYIRLARCLVFKFEELCLIMKTGVPTFSSPRNVFVVRLTSKTLYFIADSLEDAREWFELLELLVNNCKFTRIGDDSDKPQLRPDEKEEMIIKESKPGTLVAEYPTGEEPKPKPERMKKVFKEPEPEVLPEKREEHLKIGFLHRYAAGLLSMGWKRNLVALSDGAVQFYFTAKDYSDTSRRVAGTLHLTHCDGVSTYEEDKAPRKPGVPPNTSCENGFVIRILGKANYFVADTAEEAKEWLDLLTQNREKHYKAPEPRRKSVNEIPVLTAEGGATKDPEAKPEADSGPKTEAKPDF